MSSNIVSFNCPNGSTIEEIAIENNDIQFCPLEEAQKFANVCKGKEKCELDSKNLACDNYNFDVKYECHQDMKKIMDGKVKMYFESTHTAKTISTTNTKSENEQKVENAVLVDGETEHEKVNNEAPKEEAPKIEEKKEEPLVDKVNKVDKVEEKLWMSAYQERIISIINDYFEMYDKTVKTIKENHMNVILASTTCIILLVIVIIMLLRRN